MKWFKSKKKEIQRMEMLQSIRPTSKANLKTQCLIFAKGNVEEAKKLYDFYIDGMEDLPTFEPTPTTWTEDVGNKMNELFGWVRNNQDVISQGFDFVNGFIQKRKGMNMPNVQQPPIVNPLPPINE